MSDHDAFEDFARSLEAADEAVEASDTPSEPTPPSTGTSDDELVDHFGDYLEYAELERARISAKKRAYTDLIRAKFGPFPAGETVIPGTRRTLGVYTEEAPIWDKQKLREIDVGTAHPTPAHLKWSYAVDPTLPTTTGGSVSAFGGRGMTALTSTMPPAFGDALKGTKTRTKIKVLR